MKTNLGYACINMELSAQGISTNRGMIKKTYLSKGINYASELALKNLKDLVKVLEWNDQRGIRVYRMSSCLFPWMSEYKFEDLPDYVEILATCKMVGEISERSGQRLSFHPGHFDILASQNPTRIEATILDLNQHGFIMDMMGLRRDHYNTINIHVGGAYGDKVEAMKRFCENFQKLDDSAKSRLTVENDDKINMYSTRDLYEGIHSIIGIPIIFDYHHHRMCNGDLSEEQALKLASTTWPKGIVQLTHYSSSKKDNEDSKSNKQAHADYVYEKINQYGLEIDIEVESKMKEVSIFDYLDKFENDDLLCHYSGLPSIKIYENSPL
jgi:UV DNA damage endonuclease